MRCDNVLVLQGPTVDLTRIAMGANPLCVQQTSSKTKNSIFGSWGLVWDVRAESMFVTDDGDDWATLETKFSTRSAPPIDFYDYLSLSGMEIFASYYNPTMDMAGTYSGGDQLYIEGVSNVSKTSLEEMQIYDLLVENYGFDHRRKMDYIEKEDQNRIEFNTRNGGKVVFGYGVDGLLLYDEVNHSVFVIVVEGGHGLSNWQGETIGDGFWVSVETGEYDMLSPEDDEDGSITENSAAELDEADDEFEQAFDMSICEKDIPILQEELRRILDSENYA